MEMLIKAYISKINIKEKVDTSLLTIDIMRVILLMAKLTDSVPFTRTKNLFLKDFGEKMLL